MGFPLDPRRTCSYSIAPESPVPGSSSWEPPSEGPGCWLGPPSASGWGLSTVWLVFG